ncbi:MAG: HAMP domain-containing histidine kinase [Bacteroidales bacterium]|nr:HAMP domain-containing histidine kinase [Bacteroidales bacterium]
MDDRITSWIIRFVPFPNEDQLEGMAYWRAKFLYFLILGMMSLGAIAYVPSFIVSIKHDIWSIAIVDTLAMVLVFILGFSKRMKIRVKIYFILGITYVLGITLQIILGPMGAGLVWLFLFPVLSAILLNFKAVIWSEFTLFVSFLILGIPILLEWPGNYLLVTYNPLSWLVNSINFLAVSTLIAISVSLILARLEATLTKEKQISDLLKKEKIKAEEADKLKTAFLANMSHEIRTPMNGILGFMDLLREPELGDAKKERYINLLQSSGERMLRIINDLVNISKIEANQMEINLERADIRELLVDTIEFFRPKAQQKNLELNCQINLEEKDKWLFTDKDKVVQVISNLIQNAIKFTRDGRVFIHCTVENGDLLISIHDTGMGIKPEFLNKVFERFHHTGSKYEYHQEGAGLGLAISKAFVEMLGGKIWFESVLHQGSVFYLSLPINQQETVFNQVNDS